MNDNNPGLKSVSPEHSSGEVYVNLQSETSGHIRPYEYIVAAREAQKEAQKAAVDRSSLAQQALGMFGERAVEAPLHIEAANLGRNVVRVRTLAAEHQGDIESGQDRMAA